MSRRIRVQVEEKWYTVQLEDVLTNPVRALVDGEPVEVEVEGLPATRAAGAPASSLPASAATGPVATTPSPAAGPITVIRAPMLGVIVSVAVNVDDRVPVGAQLCVLEALKLHQAIPAPVAGTVSAIRVRPGQPVTSGQPIVELRPNPDTP
ncbi:MAG: biotin/lipoyl-binding protein [Chloroflexi bacterium]|nr:biotin/lipoyl-binding protein [Chloroflexota bacterium]